MVKLNKKLIGKNRLLLSETHISNGRWLLSNSILEEDCLELSKDYLRGKFNMDVSDIPDGAEKYLTIEGEEAKMIPYLWFAESYYTSDKGKYIRLFKTKDKIVGINQAFVDMMDEVPFDKIVYADNCIKFIFDNTMIAAIMEYKLEKNVQMVEIEEEAEEKVS